MAASAKVIESLKRSAECKICFGKLNNPKLLPCAHSFCKQCLDGLLEFNQDGSAIVRCPNRCKNGTARIGVNETTEILPKNYDLINILEILDQTVQPDEQSFCQVNTCQNNIQSLCVGCKRKNCGNCFQNHNCERKHQLPIYYDENREDFYAICEQHQSLALIACITCDDRMMCTYCFHRNHDRTHLHDNIYQRADATRDTLKSGLNRGAEYFKKTKFSYADQLNYIQELGNQLELESKANLAREIADFIKAGLKKHEDTMNEFYAAVVSHREYLEKHDFLDGDMETVVNRFREKVNNMKNVDLLADKWSMQDEIIDVSSIRCFSLQLNESCDLMSEQTSSNLHVSTCNVSVKTDEIIEPISFNIRELKNNETKLNKSLEDIQKHLKTMQPTLKTIDKEKRVVEDLKGLQSLDLMQLNKAETTPEPLTGEVQLIKLFLSHPEKITSGMVLQAFEQHYIQLLRIIVTNKKDLICNNAFILLHKAVKSRFIKGVQLITDACTVDLNQTDKNGETVLHKVCRNGCTKIVSILLGKTVSINKQNKNGCTPLMMAADEGNNAIIRLLLNNGASIDMIDGNGWTALMIATYNGFSSTVKLLLEKNADKNFEGSLNLLRLCYGMKKHDKSSACPNIVVAIAQRMMSYLEEVKLLKQSCVIDSYMLKRILFRDFDRDENLEYNYFKGTALMIAVISGHTNIIEIFLDYNASIDWTFDYEIASKDSSWDGQLIKGFTTLMLAVLNGNKDVVKLLLNHNATVDQQNSVGSTALMFAACFGHKEIVEILLNHNANLDTISSDGFNALIHTAQFGHKDIVELLLNHNANVDTESCDRELALLIAALVGHKDVAELLLQHNANINIQDKDGGTALMKGAQSGHKDVVELLLKHNANLDIKNNDGKTALMIAQEHGHIGIVSLLNIHVAK